LSELQVAPKIHHPPRAGIQRHADLSAERKIEGGEGRQRRHRGRVEGRPKVVEAQFRSEAARRRLELEIAVELGGMAAAVRHEGEVPGKAFAAAPQGGIEALRFPGDAELLVGDGQRRVDDPNFV